MVKQIFWHPFLEVLKKRALQGYLMANLEPQVERTEVDLPPSGGPSYRKLEQQTPIRWSCCCLCQKKLRRLCSKRSVFCVTFCFWSHPGSYCFGVIANMFYFESLPRLSFALRRAFPVGVLAAGSLWHGVSVGVALRSLRCQKWRFFREWSSHPKNRKSL